MTSEYEAVLGNEPLAQGDVFEWVELHKARPWKTFGVIVTADCDLFQDKANGRISYVPAFTAEDYLWHFWKNKRLAPVLKSNFGKLRVRTSKLLIAQTEGAAELSEEAMTYMIRQHRENLPDIIGLKDKGQIAIYRTILDKVIALIDLLGSENPNLVQLVSCYQHLTNKTGTENQEQLVKDFQSALGTLPGDIFHITTTSGMEDGGLFLLLRYISQCDVSDIAVRPEDLRFGSAKARRIGRIAAPFRYAMTQNLGRVFSDIGLPEAYAERQSSSSARFFTARLNT